MVKLNIEMSMADMIVKVARTSEQDMNFGSSSQGTPCVGTHTNQKTNHTFNDDRDETHGVPKNVTNTAFVGHNRGNEDTREDIHGIKRQTEVQVYVGDSDTEDRSIDLEHGKPTTRDFTRDRDTFAVNNRTSHHSNDSQIPMHELGSPIGRAISSWAPSASGTQHCFDLIYHILYTPLAFTAISVFHLFLSGVDILAKMFPSHCFPESSQPLYISGSNLHSAESLPHSYASSPNAVAIVTLCKL
jgi:hypothetical protein